MDVARKLGGAVTVVKAQIHAGGRGKGRFKDDPNGKGGVRVSKSVEEVGANAAAMLGHDLVTKQTGPAGKTVKRLYVEEGCDIKRELYLSLLVDRAVSRISVVASTEGGMDIETVAHDTPDKIVKQSIDPASGYQSYEGRKIAFALGLTGKQVNAFVALLGSLYRAFTELDCSLIEINPLVVTGSGDIMRCDVIAEGVVAAAREVNLHVPLVVRLEGTNVELGKKILKESGLKITSAENLADAAQKIVQAVKESN